jgi:predicted Zn finger-like uncharacterized protein
MIINCEKCGSKFNLDENLLNKNGSKVRCSVCKNIFIAMPPEPEEDIPDPSLEETVDLDSPPVFEEAGGSIKDGYDTDEDFDTAFKDALDEDIQQEEVEEEAEQPQTEQQKTKGKNRRPGLILIIIIAVFVIILGALSVYLFAPGILPEGPSGMRPPVQEDLTDTGNRRLEIMDLDGSFFRTGKIGQLYIIKGKILNNYPQSRSNILVKGTIEDEKRNPIDRKLAYAGNIFTEYELKDITIEEIEKRLKNKSGKNNSNIDVAPHESVPFMIIFYNLPDSISEYVVETVSSSPGQ